MISRLRDDILRSRGEVWRSIDIEEIKYELRVKDITEDDVSQMRGYRQGYHAYRCGNRLRNMVLKRNEKYVTNKGYKLDQIVIVIIIFN